MRFLQADRLYPVSGDFIPEGIVVADGQGVILDVIDPVLRPEEALQLAEAGRIERHHGWLIPGMINAHCHLELSRMRGRTEPGGGLADFIRQIVRLRSETTPDVQQAMLEAEEEMLQNGIVAVGDISNTDDSLSIKSKGRLRYHTFIETFDLRPEEAALRFGAAADLAQRFRDNGLEASVTPHAPYTVSSGLMKRIGRLASERRDVVSIHNQESADEAAMFVEGAGGLLRFLQSGGNMLSWQPSGRSSLTTYLDDFPSGQSLLLVHNTYTTEEDLSEAMSSGKDLWWCFCPKANLFIEGHLPDIPLFLRREVRFLIGTDSVASNRTLSVLEEMKTIAAAYPGAEFGKLLRAATLDAAVCFGWSGQLGSIEINKKPGINLLEDTDSNSPAGITPGTAVKRLL
jgi:cytosine/adenosine deaminase-related metal-dependent hydrolase